MVLVTGATGFVGRRLIGRIIEEYGRDQVLCLVYDQANNQLETSGRANLDHLGVKYIPVDLISGRGLDKVPKSPDVVFHIASCTDTGAKDHSINNVGTQNLVQAIQPLKNTTHFVFTSTIAVSDHRKNSVAPVSEETTLLSPYNEYGRKKLLTEKFLKEKCAADKFQLTIIRVCAVYGQGTRKDGLYDQLIRLAKNDALISRFDYPGKMSVIHVDDLSDILVAVSKKSPPPGKPALFIPVGEVLSAHEMSEQIYSDLGKSFRPITLPRFFWNTCRVATKALYKLEPVIPHQIYNKIWQLSLLVNNSFYNQSKLLPDSIASKQTMRTFRDSIREIARR